MPKRRIDPTTGEPELTYREQILIDHFIKNGGNGTRAAASAGYSSTRPDQSAYQVLRRPEVQHRINQRIAESQVSADEIIGTLASIMRGTLADFLDESGQFSMKTAVERGVDHLLRNITTTTREIKATKDQPAQAVSTHRGSLHSPIQAARLLAQIIGLTAKRNHPLTTDHRSLTTDPRLWLEDLIQQQMVEQKLSRAAVIDCLLSIRPEIARYLQQLPESDQPDADQSQPDHRKRLAVIMDSMMAMVLNPDASPRTDPVIEAAEQIDALIDLSNTATDADSDAPAHPQIILTSQAVEEALDRINSRLTGQQQDELTRLRIEAIIHRRMTQPDLTQAEAFALICQEAATLPGVNDPPTNDFIEYCIAEYLATHPPTLAAAPPPNSTPASQDLAPTSVPKVAVAAAANLTSPALPGAPRLALPSATPVPTPDPRLKTPDSRLQTPDSRLQTPDSRLQTPDSPPRILPGLERYILPTDYIGDWPPTSSAITGHRPPTTGHLPPAPAQNSQSLPMSSPKEESTETSPSDS